MTDRCDWVEIVEPRTQEHMYANLATGECVWHPPSGVKIRRTTEDCNQWWELYDSNTSRFYYYNANLQKTVWHKPPNCDIIPLAKLQTLKHNTQAIVADNETNLSPPNVQREISTQTPHKKGYSTTGMVRGSNRMHGSENQSHIPQTKNNHIQRLERINSASTQRSTNSDSRSGVTSYGSAHRGTNGNWAHRGSKTTQKKSTGVPEGIARRPGNHIERSSPESFSLRHGKATQKHGQEVSGAPFPDKNVVSPSILPQRSLESPKPQKMPNVDFDIQRAIGGSQKSNEPQNSLSEFTRSPLEASPNLQAARNQSNHFQRQDSFPMMREHGSNRVHTKDPMMAQFQDVSQITAVQVTPRPKPRAFPRTNPSFVGTRRRDGVPSSYQKFETGSTGVFNKTFVDASLYGTFERPGSQTLQLSRSYLMDKSLVGNMMLDNAGDSDGSVSSTSSGASDQLPLQQHTLSLKRNSGIARSSNCEIRSNAGVMSLRRPTDNVHRTSQAFVQTGMTSNPPATNNPPATSAKISADGRHVPMPNTQQLKTSKDKDVTKSWRPDPQPFIREDRTPLNIAERGQSHRNSEPDYVNVPPSKSELNSDNGSHTLRREQQHRTETETYDKGNSGTLRSGDHASPADFADYVNSEDMIKEMMNSLQLDSKLFDGEFCDGNGTVPQVPPRQAHSPAQETHHPSLRRRKWIEKPSAQLRQSTLEKCLSLQAELAQQRPMSMVVPFGGDGNAIVNQVADSLMQQMDIERFLSENLNEHRKGILGKTVPVGNMLSWTKDMIQKPMIRTENRVVKKEALEVFRLIQTYMGDKKSKDPATVVACELINKGWSIPELRDEIYIQLCRQTTRNPKDQSLMLGWELMALCLGFLPPSPKFQSYLDSYIHRTREARDHTDQNLLHRYANVCSRRLERTCQLGAKHKPTLDEVEHSKKCLVQPSMFSGTLVSIMDLQKEKLPNARLPWIQTTLSEELLKLNANQLTEGIFRVPGDTDEVNALKSKCDEWIPPTNCTDPHILASLLKLWYRELYEPLVPCEFYDQCVESFADAEAAVKVVDQLPEINRLVLQYLVRFLQKFALPDIAAITKMDANNLAMVMAPNCLRCESTDPQVLFENARKEMGFMRQLINKLDTECITELV